MDEAIEIDSSNIITAVESIYQKIEKLKGDVEAVYAKLPEEPEENLVTNLEGLHIFLGEYLDSDTNTIIKIERDRFVIGYLQSTGIVIENPTYDLNSDFMTVSGQAIDGFDGSEYFMQLEIHLRNSWSISYTMGSGDTIHLDRRQ